jgi:hypothetical protein
LVWLSSPHEGDTIVAGISQMASHRAMARLRKFDIMADLGTAPKFSMTKNKAFYLLRQTPPGQTPPGMI